MVNNIHLEAIMNIPEWQAKMIRSSPKSIMKHANKQLELLGVLNDENGNIKETAKLHLQNDDKKVRKGNIDLLTGKRKYTKKLLKFDGVLSNSELFDTFLKTSNQIHFHFHFQNLKSERNTSSVQETWLLVRQILMCRVSTHSRSEYVR